MSLSVRVLLLFIPLVLTRCAILEDHAFTVTGNEVNFIFPEQYESQQYRLTREVTNPDIEERLKARGLPMNMLASVKLASLRLYVSAQDPDFGISSLQNVKINASLGGFSSLPVATGDFTGFTGDEGLLTVLDEELLEYVSAETMEFTVQFMLAEQPEGAIDIRLEPEFTAVVNVLN